MRGGRRGAWLAPLFLLCALAPAAGLAAPPPTFPRPAGGEADTPARVALGRRLFHDQRLSINGTASCATCHQPDRAFSDGRTSAIGATGQAHRRNTPTLTNVALNATLGWADPAPANLAAQHRRPLFGRQPLEMGLTDPLPASLVALLEGDATYAGAFAAAFPTAATPIDSGHLLQAIASFVRTLLSYRSPFDARLFDDDRSQMSAPALRGMQLFLSARLGCAHCHAGVNLSGPLHTSRRSDGSVFHNTALYDIDGAGGYPATDRGLIEKSGRPADMGAFRAPTLRNIALTAPYMHDGSVATLGEVIDLYGRGGRAPNNRYKAAELRGFQLSSGERTDLLAFLQALTDTAFVADPAHRRP